MAKAVRFLPSGPSEFRRAEIHNEYYRRIRIDHAIAIPMHADCNTLASFAGHRKRPDFSDRDRDLPDVLRPHLAADYRASVAQALRRTDNVFHVWGRYAVRSARRKPAYDPETLEHI